MMSPDSLVAVVRLKLLAGLLPRTEQVVGWAGHGEGYPCAACDGRVTAADVEYEWNVSDGSTLRFHWACFRLWAVEQYRVGAAPDAVRHILVARPQALCGECLATKASGGAPEPVRGAGVKAPGLDAFDVRPGRCGGCGRHTSVVAYRAVPPRSAEAV
jgi:hypothetical protein